MHAHCTAATVAGTHAPWLLTSQKRIRYCQHDFKKKENRWEKSGAREREKRNLHLGSLDVSNGRVERMGMDCSARCTAASSVFTTCFSRYKRYHNCSSCCGRKKKRSTGRLRLVSSEYCVRSTSYRFPRRSDVMMTRSSTSAKGMSYHSFEFGLHYFARLLHYSLHKHAKVQLAYFVARKILPKVVFSTNG